MAQWIPFLILQVHWKKEENSIFTTLKLKYPGVHCITKRKQIILTDENINELTKEETQDDDNEVKEEFEGNFIIRTELALLNVLI